MQSVTVEYVIRFFVSKSKSKLFRSISDRKKGEASRALLIFDFATWPVALDHLHLRISAHSAKSSVAVALYPFVSSVGPFLPGAHE